MFSYPYPRPAVTVDAIVFSIQGIRTEILLIKRGNPPFEDLWAVPGGFIDLEETPEEAVKRELMEETGISGVEFFQVHTYGAVKRDPRHRTISIAYAGMLHDNAQEATGGDDAAEAGWFPIDQLPLLAFDHHQIITDAINFGKEKGWF